MHTHYDAIIIGAGPAGSSTAILLARAGWRVALIEKHAFPRRKVCGECVAATNLPLLNKLGIGAAIAAIASKSLQQVALMYGDTTVVGPLPEFSNPHYPWGKALDRETLDTLLIRQAEHCGASIFQPWAAKDISGQAGNYRCTIEINTREASTTEPGIRLDDQNTNAAAASLNEALVDTDLIDSASLNKTSLTLTAPVLIAAHGSWELGPTKERHQPKHKASDLFAFKANYLRSSLPESLLPVLSFPGGYGGMVLGEHGNTTLAFCIRRDALAKARQRWPQLKAAEAAAEYVKQNCLGVKLVLQFAILQGDWLSVGPIRPGIRMMSTAEPNAGRNALQSAGGIAEHSAILQVFKVGNAAGEAHPIIGEGISMAIQSAFVLSGILLKPDSKPINNSVAGSGERYERWHQQYVQEWRQHFQLRIRFAAILAHIAMRPALMAAIVHFIKVFPQSLKILALLGSKTRALQLPNNED